MTHLRLAAPALAALLLSACAAPAPAPDAPPSDGTVSAGEALGDMPLPVLPNPATDTCGGSALTGYIGQDAGSIDAARFQNPIRVIPAGSAVTQDFNPQRINFELDTLNEVVRVRCG
ncbi:I78 family peptidase inhibitor [Rubellimicrobium arenae]|uniref:I78 family peptidase inhibitor n=1 Tax=Rubellimicrobium arenae TaxID=2817372 RepID=UPI001B311256|nr:I78 family peptidase inhibitor [Rubellimicrobium arenae]